MAGPEIHIIAANEPELVELKNQCLAERIILAVIGVAFAVAACIMLLRFWEVEAQRHLLFVVLALLSFVYAFLFLRNLQKVRAVKRGEEFVLISGVITGKHIEGNGSQAEYFIAINGEAFNVGPEVHAETSIGARLGVREWKHNREFFDYTLSQTKLDEMLQRAKRG
jgi:hypothetical protein